MKNENNEEYKKLIKGEKLDLKSLDFEQSEIKREYRSLNPYRVLMFNFSRLITFYINISKKTLPTLHEETNINGESPRYRLFNKTCFTRR